MYVLEDITMVRFETERQSVRTIIIPCGSLEEHGPHLPLGTDTFHAVALAREASRKASVWVAPPLWYGVCRSSSEHPGTVGIRSRTLHRLLKDVIRGFYAQGIRRFVVLSGHAGGTHMATLLDAAEESMAELPESAFAVLSVLDLGKEAWRGVQATPGDSHAGEVETSLMLHLHPDRVQGSAPEEYPSFPPHLLVRNKRAFWAHGVWGNPALASAEKGRTLMERSTDALVELIRRLEAWREPSGNGADGGDPLV
jgi:creatinine amidohydrolase